jgi:RES domain-containing protein
VVYLGETPADVLLEMCAHTAADDVPPTYTLLRIEGPEVEVSEVSRASLPRDWTDRIGMTQEIGTTWLKSRSGALLRIPSAIAPHTANYLLNPLHELAGRFRITEAMEWPFDGRLKQ